VRSMHQKEQQQQEEQAETVQAPAELSSSVNSTTSAANVTASDAVAADSTTAKDVIAGICNEAMAATATAAGDAAIADDISTATESTIDVNIDVSSESYDAGSEHDDWLFDSESASESDEYSNSDDRSSVDSSDADAIHDDEPQLADVAGELLLEPEPMPPVIDTAAPNIAAVPVAVLGDTLQLSQAVAASANSLSDTSITTSSSASSSAIDTAAAANATEHPLQALQQWWDREFNFRGFGIGVVKPVFAGSLFRRQDFGVGIRLPLTSHFHSWEVSCTCA
jgi:hypothetical protein